MPHAPSAAVLRVGYHFGQLILPLLFIGGILLLLNAACPPLSGLGATTVHAQSGTLTCSWTDHPIIPGTTPLRAIQIMEIRACLDAISSRINDTDDGDDDDDGGGGGDGGEDCPDAWSESRRGYDVINTPACVGENMHLRVDPVAVVSAFAFWARPSLASEWSLVVEGRVDTVNCALGFACHFEGVYYLPGVAQVAMTMAGLVDWTVTYQPATASAAATAPVGMTAEQWNRYRGTWDDLRSRVEPPPR